MFCCIGIKVKWLARVFLWLGALASVIGGVLTMVIGIGPFTALVGTLIIVLGLLASLVVSWITYAIGVSADAHERR